MKVDWVQPPSMWAVVTSANMTNPNATKPGEWNSTDATVTYVVTCKGPSVSTQTKETPLLAWTFSGVQAGMDYTCHVQMKVVNNSVTYLSAESESTTVTTLEGKSKTLTLLSS